MDATTRIPAAPGQLVKIRSFGRKDDHYPFPIYQATWTFWGNHFDYDIHKWMALISFVITKPNVAILTLVPFIELYHVDINHSKRLPWDLVRSPQESSNMLINKFVERRTKFECKTVLKYARIAPSKSVCMYHGGRKTTRKSKSNK